MITVENLTKSYSSYDQSAVTAVRGINFQVKEGEFYTLLGPSGCGKTTTLRCLAGFETPEDGELSLGDEIVFSAPRGINRPPNRRDFGIVFQSYAIWPHMTVAENVAFPLKYGRHRVHGGDLDSRVARALKLVQLEELANRPAPFLSGGQQQRVALARALVHEPTVLLLDEPLSNLDAKLREEMRTEVSALVKRLGITTLYVTHDQIEALSMSDRVAVMRQGVIAQEGTPLEIYNRPADQFVASFVGAANFLDGQIADVDASGSGTIKTAQGAFHCSVAGSLAEGDPAVLVVRPENVVLSRCASAAPPSVDADGNRLMGVVQAAVFVGEALDCRVQVDGATLRVKTHPSNAVRPGDHVGLHIPTESSRAIRRDD